MQSSKIEGVRELSQQIKKLSKSAAPRVLRPAVRESLKPARQLAEGMAPADERDWLRELYTGKRVAPGFLRRHIRIRTFAPGDKTRIIGYLGPTREAFYGTQFVEVGTSYMPAQPWLVPAFRASLPFAIRRLKRKLKFEIDKAVKTGRR